MYQAYVTELKNVREHPNADRLKIGQCFGNDVIVSLEYEEGDLGIYFPTDGQLSEEYCKINNLVRKKDPETGENIGGYLDPNKRNIRSMRLRGEPSDGLFMPLSSLEEFINTSNLKAGDTITTLNGKLICQKYIPKQNKPNNTTSPKTKKKEDLVKYPLFEQHKDTKQLAYNLNTFQVGDLCTISLKMHGTSARTANTIKKTKAKSNIFNNMLIGLGLKKKYTQEYDYVTGSRRVTLTNFDNGYYGTNEFREKYHNLFNGKLMKGETVFYEIVGWVNDDTTIMSKGNNKKLGKEFVKKYGKTTIFSYGCEEGDNDIYVYRMTMTNEDGYVVEYPTWLVKQRCEQMGIKTAPVFEQFEFTNQDDLMERVNKYMTGADPIDKTHLREGVVVRVENKGEFTVYKHKSFNFKILEGIIKDSGISDMEEMDGE